MANFLLLQAKPPPSLFLMVAAVSMLNGPGMGANAVNGGNFRYNGGFALPNPSKG